MSARFSRFERDRAAALAMGPGEEWIDRCVAEVCMDDTEIDDAHAMVCHEELAGLLADAYRSGDWTTYGATLSAVMARHIRDKAEARAQRQQKESWDEAGDW